jgi:hypothetical protein
VNACAIAFLSECLLVSFAANVINLVKSKLQLPADRFTIVGNLWVILIEVIVLCIPLGDLSRKILLGLLELEAVFMAILFVKAGVNLKQFRW